VTSCLLLGWPMLSLWAAGGEDSPQDSCCERSCGCRVRCWQSLAELLIDSVFTHCKRGCDWSMTDTCLSEAAYLYSGHERVGARQASQ
jgi:hypothetical protein